MIEYLWPKDERRDLLESSVFSTVVLFVIKHTFLFQLVN